MIIFVLWLGLGMNVISFCWMLKFLIGHVYTVEILDNLWIFMVWLKYVLLTVVAHQCNRAHLRPQLRYESPFQPFKQKWISKLCSSKATYCLSSLPISLSLSLSLSLSIILSHTQMPKLFLVSCIHDLIGLFNYIILFYFLIGIA